MLYLAALMEWGASSTVGEGEGAGPCSQRVGRKDDRRGVSMAQLVACERDPPPQNTTITTAVAQSTVVPIDLINL
jgi:hypothetical protein